MPYGSGSLRESAYGESDPHKPEGDVLGRVHLSTSKAARAVDTASNQDLTALEECHGVVRAGDVHATSHAPASRRGVIQLSAGHDVVKDIDPTSTGLLQGWGKERRRATK
jgi:hypothetical protein